MVRRGLDVAGIQLTERRVNRVRVHGVGRELHEAPEVPGYLAEKIEKTPLLKEGMTIAIEPMITIGDWRVREGSDGFTFKTKDGSLAAHFEHTIAITKDGPLILTTI